MKSNLLPLALQAGVILFFVFIANSCQKDITDKSQQASIDKIRADLSKLPKQTILVSNQKATSFMCDVNGNPIYKMSGTTTLSEKKQINTSCVDGYGDPIYTFDNVTYSGTVNFLCGSGGGYQLTSVWHISTALPLVASTSKGQLRIRNSGGSVVYSNTNISPISVVDLGTDPTYSGDDLYEVTYTAPYVSQSTWESGVYIDNNAQLHTTCGDPNNVSTQYLSSYSIYLPTITTDACSRIDVPYISSSYLGGSDAVGSCSLVSGYQIPNQNEISFIAVSGGAVSKVVDLNNFDVKSIVVGTGTDNAVQVYIHAGTYNIQYRNVMLPAYGNCYGPWSGLSGPYTW